MKKSLLILFLIASIPATTLARSYALKLACKAKCTSSEKDVKGALKGFQEVLDQIDKAESSYEKRHKELEGFAENSCRKSGEASKAQINLLSTRYHSGSPGFAMAFFLKHIKKHSRIEYCFSDCGTRRHHDKQSVKFMFPYFVKVIARLGVKNLRKFIRHNIPPMAVKDTLLLLDRAVRDIDEKEFNRILDKKSLDQGKYLKDARETLQQDKKHSFFLRELAHRIPAESMWQCPKSEDASAGKGIGELGFKKEKHHTPHHKAEHHHKDPHHPHYYGYHAPPPPLGTAAPIGHVTPM